MKKRIQLLCLVIILIVATVSSAQDRTVGLMVNSEGVMDGYTLFSPQRNGNIYLIDNEGHVINKWNINGTVRESYLLDNGNIIAVTNVDQNLLDTTYIPSEFFRGATGKVVELTWDNEVVWEYEQLDAKLRHHHAIQIMPNNNILMLVWSYRSLEEATEMGLDAEAYTEIGTTQGSSVTDYDFILPDAILEIEYDTKEVIWEWDTWDHLVQNFDPDKPNYGDPIDHPGRVNLNYHEFLVKGSSRIDPPDWMHSNAIAYNPELDQVALNVRSFDEVWILDHSLTTEEAQGDAGDILYRWGNPFAYGAYDNIDDRFYHNQHDTQWILDSDFGRNNIITYSNREVNDEGEEFSAIIEFKPDLDDNGNYIYDADKQLYGPEEVTWYYSAEGFYSQVISGVQRLPNGNTFVIQGLAGRMFEVTPDKELVWDYINPEINDSSLVPQGEVPLNDNNRVFRARKYSADHPGFANHDMTPGELLIE